MLIPFATYILNSSMLPQCFDCCSDWDRGRKPARGAMAVAMPAALIVLLAAVAAGGGCVYTQRKLQSMPRARQPSNDWMEESGARNQVPPSMRIHDAPSSVHLH